MACPHWKHSIPGPENPLNRELFPMESTTKPLFLNAYLPQPIYRRASGQDPTVEPFLPRLDHEALHGAAEIAAGVGEPGRGEAGAVGTDLRFRVDQNPLTKRLPREADREVGVDEGPLPEIQCGRGAVAEVGRDHGPHRLRDRKTLEQGP